MQKDITPKDLEQADKNLSKILNPNNKYKRTQIEILEEIYE